MKKSLWISLGLVLLGGLGGGLYAWQPWNTQETNVAAGGVGATYSVDRGNLSRSLTAYGEILAKDEAAFSFSEARLRSLHVKLGDTVREGDVLAVLDSTQEELSLARAERALAAARADGALSTIRERELEYSLALANYEATTIRAPFDGVVVEAARATGTSAGQFRIVVLDRSQLSVRIALSEADVGQVRAGQRATVTVDALPGLAWPAEIVEVGLRATQASGFAGGRTVPAIVRLLQADERILTGFSARVEVIVSEALNVLRVPIESLVQHTAPAPAAVESTEAASVGTGDVASRFPEGLIDSREPGESEVPRDLLTGFRERAASGDLGARPSGTAQPSAPVASSLNWAVYVFEDGEPVLRPVEIGLTTAQFAEVRSGLAEGETIVRYPTSSSVQSGTTTRTTSVPGGLFR